MESEGRIVIDSLAREEGIRFITQFFIKKNVRPYKTGRFCESFLVIFHMFRAYKILKTTEEELRNVKHFSKFVNNVWIYTSLFI